MNTQTKTESLEKILGRIRYLERDLNAQVKIGEEQREETFYDEGNRYVDGEGWVTKTITYDITEPDTSKKNAAREELQSLYDSSKWYSVRYSAGRLLAKDVESDLMLWNKKLTGIFESALLLGKTEGDFKLVGGRVVKEEERLRTLDDINHLLDLTCSQERKASLIILLSNVYGGDPVRKIRLRAGEILETMDEEGNKEDYTNLRKFYGRFYSNELACGEKLTPDELKIVFEDSSVSEHRVNAGKLLGLGETDILGNELIHCNNTLKRDQVEEIYKFANDPEARRIAGVRLGYDYIKILEEELERGANLDREDDLYRVFWSGNKPENRTKAGEILKVSDRLKLENKLKHDEKIEIDQLKEVYHYSGPFYKKLAGRQLGYSSLRIWASLHPIKATATGIAAVSGFIYTLLQYLNN